MIRPAREIDEHTPWQEMTLGGEIYEPATARYVNTGAWRTDTPVLDTAKCRHCLLCVPVCPDMSIPVNQEGKREDFNYFFCKGCGICANTCPFGAITMVKDEK